MEEKTTVKKRIIAITNLLRIEKDGKNTFANYKYFKPEDIFNKLNPLLEQYCLITPFNLKLENDHYVATLTIEDTDSDDKVVYEFDIDKAVVKGANEAQNSGATLTYAKRYSLMNAFNIADNDDDFDSDKSKAKSNKAPTGKPEVKPKNPATDNGQSEIKSITATIASLSQEKANKDGQTKETVKKILSTYHKSGNPYKIEDIDEAKKCLDEIKNI